MKTEYEKGYRDGYRNVIRAVQFLIDRDTEKHVIRQDDSLHDTGFECGECGEPVCYDYLFCPWCGQRIDWSDE